MKLNDHTIPPTPPLLSLQSEFSCYSLFRDNQTLEEVVCLNPLFCYKKGINILTSVSDDTLGIDTNIKQR